MMQLSENCVKVVNSVCKGNVLFGGAYEDSIAKEYSYKQEYGLIVGRVNGVPVDLIPLTPEDFFQVADELEKRKEIEKIVCGNIPWWWITFQNSNFQSVMERQRNFLSLK